MTVRQSFPIVEPTLFDVLQQLKEDIFTTLRVCVPGQIISFDGTKRTASIKILLKRVMADGRLADYQPLADVPVWAPQGGGASLQFPLAAGDQGLVLFADRNIGAWFQNGAVAPMPDFRAHTLSDGIFVPGLNALNSNLPAYPTSEVVLTYQGSQFKVTASGLKLIGTGGAEIDLNAAIVTIKNATTTLNTLMGQFITLLEALTIQDDEGGNILPLTAASIAALEAFKIQFAGLLG